MTDSATPSNFWEAAPKVLGVGAFIGGGARIAKTLFDLYRRDDPEGTPVVIKPTEDPITEIPVPVSHEEAAELRRKGLPVKHASGFFDSMSPTDSLGVGALGTLALFGGWKAADKIIDTQRQAAADEAREKIRHRISSIMNDTPAPEDVQFHAQMKAAEAVHFYKEAGWPFAEVINPLAALLGGGLTVSAMRAYNEAYANSPDSGKIKALKGYLRSRKVQTPTVTTVPVEVDEQAGSPAEQAALNAQAG